MGELVTDRLRAHVAEFVGRVPDGAGPPSVDDVHQARVALRRLRSDLRLFAPVLDADAVAPLRREISWFAGELGELRDLDVMAEVVVLLAGPAGVDAADVVAGLVTRRAEAEQRLIRTLAGGRAGRLRRDLAAFAADPPLTGRVDRGAERVLAVQVRRAWRHLERAVAAAGDGAPVEAVHEVRIRVKRVRYAVDSVTTDDGRESKLGRRLAALQDHLGDFHDRVVVEAWLRDHGPRADVASTAFAAGALAVEARHDAERLASSWRPLWERAHAAQRR